MKEEILNKLIEKTASKMGVDKSTLSGNTKIKTEINLRSLELAGIISEFEEEYDCYIKYPELMHAETIEQAAEVIAKSCE